MHSLLQTRVFSLNACPVSPEQKKNLFASVAELFEQVSHSYQSSR
jgi:hypothetical protein